MATKAVTLVLTFFGSSSATRPVMTPSSSSFWMRRQQGVVDSPTRRPISATGTVASFLQDLQDLAVEAVDHFRDLRDIDFAYSAHSWDIFPHGAQKGGVYRNEFSDLSIVAGTEWRAIGTRADHRQQLATRTRGSS